MGRVPREGDVLSVVVVTGASSGIGAATAVELGQRGHDVVLAARTRKKLEDVAQQIPSSLVVECDVTKRGDHERLLEAAVQGFGKVDVWINNAGRAISRPVLELTDDDVDAMIRDNVKSVLYGMQIPAKYFKERGEGAIVNVSSLLSRNPVMAPIRSMYSASKAAMNSLTETLRMELAQTNIRVVTVLPGVVATDFGLNAMHGGPDNRKLPGAQPVEDVARVVADAALSAKGDVYTFPGAADRVFGYLKQLQGSS